MLSTQVNRKLPFRLSLVINEVIRSSLSKKYPAVKVITLFSEVPFPDLAKSLSMLKASFDYREVNNEDEFFLYSCTSARRVGNDIISGNFYVLQKKPFLYFITGERTPFFTKLLIPMAAKLFPKAIRTYVTSDDLQFLLKDFSEKKNVSLRYNEFVYKRMFGDAFTATRRDRRQNVNKYASFIEAFEKASEQGGWLDRIRVFGNGYAFSISRSGTFKFTNGTFDDYHEYFLTKIGDLALKRWKIFEKRSREEVPNKEVKPVLVNFNSNVFEQTEDRKQFLSILESYSNCEYSVIHAGNPHLNVAILDKLDNSSFTVRTYGIESLMLIPQIRTTSASLVRFSKHLIDSFQEGTLSEFEPEAIQ
jgi:hypothetical protein